MFNVVVEIKAPEIIAVLKELVAVLVVKRDQGSSVVTEIQYTAAPAQALAPAAPAPEIQYYPPAQAPTAVHAPAAAPVALVPPMPAPVTPPAAVPVTPQTYSMEQLAVAATQLVDAGRRAELVGLLASFGVQALTALPKEQYGNFATQLRAMGAKI